MQGLRGQLLAPRRLPVKELPGFLSGVNRVPTAQTSDLAPAAGSRAHLSLIPGPSSERGVSCWTPPIPRTAAPHHTPHGWHGAVLRIVPGKEGKMVTSHHQACSRGVWICRLGELLLNICKGADSLLSPPAETF